MNYLHKMKGLFDELAEAENKINNLKKSLDNVNTELSQYVDQKAVNDYLELELNIIEQLKEELIKCLKGDEDESTEDLDEPAIISTKPQIKIHSYMLPTNIVTCKCGVKVQKRRMTEHVKTARHKNRAKQFNLKLYKKNT